MSTSINETKNVIRRSYLQTRHLAISEEERSTKLDERKRHLTLSNPATSQNFVRTYIQQSPLRSSASKHSIQSICWHST